MKVKYRGQIQQVLETAVFSIKKTPKKGSAERNRLIIGGTCQRKCQDSGFNAERFVRLGQISAESRAGVVIVMEFS